MTLQTMLLEKKVRPLGHVKFDACLDVRFLIACGLQAVPHIFAVVDECVENCDEEGSKGKPRVREKLGSTPYNLLSRKSSLTSLC